MFIQTEMRLQERNASMHITTLLEMLFGKRLKALFPGALLVFIALESLHTILVNEQGNQDRLQHMVILFLILLAGFLAYVAGNVWDYVVYDPLFSAPSSRDRRLRKLLFGVWFPIRWLLDRLPPCKNLEKARKEAMAHLDSQRRKIGQPSNQEDEYEGLHKTATKLFSHTSEYEEKIGWWLELSKAIRAFLFPLCALIGYLYFFPGNWPFPENTLLSFFWSWWVELGVFVLALGLYLSFRVLHVRRLYEGVDASKLILGQGPKPDSVFVQMPVPKKDLPYMTPAEPIPDDWLWFLAEGVILVLLGIAASIVPPIAGLTATIFIGWMLLVRGVADVVVTLWGRRSPGFIHLVLAVRCRGLGGWRGVVDVADSDWVDVVVRRDSRPGRDRAGTARRVTEGRR